jgi:peptide/nickel transport system ATP-binding protein
MSQSIKVEDLSVFAGNTRLLGPVSFAVSPGASLVIMGETGAGKSLIAQAILGTLPASLRADGQIVVNGRDLNTLTPVERAAMWGHELATLPQEPWRALDPLMRAFPQVSETFRHVANMSAAQARRATEYAFETLDLTGAERRLPGALSGGMAQRVAFAAATAGNAPILLADEPTKGLDAERHDKVVSLLAEVPASGGTLLTITHEVSVARRLGGQVIVLRNGQLVEQGDAETVLTTPASPYTQDLLNAAPQNWPRSKPHTAGEVVLTAHDLTLARNGSPLISGFDLTLRAGERVALTGPSGVGKTTLLDALAGLLPPVRGTVKRGPSLSRTTVQKLYQDPPAAFPARVPLRLTLQDVARSHGTDWDRVELYLEDLGVHPSLLERRPDAVSGGELQRISIARALTVGPRILLADEPTSRLDPITQRDTLAMLARVAAKEDIAVVLVTHDPCIASNWADRVIDLA